MKKTFCFLFTALLFLLSLTGCEQTASEPLLQELPPQKGEDIAVMETSLGTIKLRFFPEQAPMAVLLYEHEARLGDTLQITGCQIGPDSWYLAGYRSGQRCFAAQAAFDRA